MDSDDMAAALAFELNKAPWAAEVDGFDEIIFTNEDGEHFRLTVEKIDGEEQSA